MAMITVVIAIVLFFLSPMRVDAAVVVNELFPKTSDPALSWIELYNNGSDAVSLDRWTLGNTGSPTKTYMMNASFIIPSHAYLVFSQAQTGITFSLAGDSVRLVDDKGGVADSQSYESTLGYNVAIGRSIDGGGSWSICTIQTPGKVNTCPELTVTPTSVSTFAPMATLTPISSTPPPLTSEPAKADSDAIFVPPSSLGLTYKPTMTLTPTVSPDVISFDMPKTIRISKILLQQIGVVLFAWSLLVVIARRRGQKKRKKNPNLGGDRE